MAQTTGPGIAIKTRSGAADSVEVNAAGNETNDSTGGAGPIRILAVEDDVAVGMVLRFACKQAGYELELANDLRSGRAALKNGDPDLVLLDLHLPDGHGFELLRHIRDELGRSTPVIVLSGVKQWDSITRGMGLGASEYLTKPFSPQGLLAHVAGWTAIPPDDAVEEQLIATEGVYVVT